MPPKRNQPVRAPPPPKRKRVYDEDEDDDDDDELSELSDTSPTDPTANDEEDDELSSELDSPESEAEDSYASEGAQDESDEDEVVNKPHTLTTKATKVSTQRATTTRRAIATQSTPKKPATVTAKKDSAVEIPTVKNTTAVAPTIRLKIGKDKLREATSSWTPPPGAADSHTTPTAAATQESAASLPIVSSMKPSATTGAVPRGRKVVQEVSSEDDESKEDEDDEMVDVDAEGEDEELDEDAEGDEDELNDEDAEGETDEEMADSEDEANGNTPGTDFLSRIGTPTDMSRLTNRQRTRMGDITTADHLLELPSGYEKPGAAKPVTLSAHEQELKRAEMARRRKNLTDQRLEEEKMDTINRLLKKQTPKMRRGRNTGTAGDATPANKEEAEAMGIEMPPPPTMVRWVSNKEGSRLSVPDSWLSSPIGKVFEPQTIPKFVMNQ
ncbi:PAPA-1-like conserved region-domain-containing protein [Geopyxis carbonaria]|nr:PAPA-1-like conserved region-domain-containing protein [Geopyxis carbonaria]